MSGLEISTALLKILEKLNIRINWKSPRIKIVGKNIYILSQAETSKVLRSKGLPLVGNKEVVQGYVRADLREEEISSLSLPEKLHKMIRSMKEYLSTERYSALIQAYNVKKFEEEGKPKKASRVLNHLRDRWGPMGSKIYNLVESGFFENLIYPEFQSIVQKHGENKDAARGEFSRFFDKMLGYFRYGVWVTSRDSVGLIKAKIMVRRETEPIIFAFARKVGNIKTLDKAVNSLIEEEPDKYAKLEVSLTIRGAKGKNIAIGDPKIIESLKQSLGMSNKSRLKQKF